MHSMTDVALAVGDQVRVTLPCFTKPFNELHIFWEPLREYFAHPDGPEAELTHQQVVAAPKDFQAVVMDDCSRTHFVPVVALRRA